MKNVERSVEAHLISIEISEEQKAIKLALRDVNGKSFWLSAQGLHRLVVSELRETNVIECVNIWDSSDDPASYKNSLRGLVCGESDTRDARWKEVLELEMEAVRNGSRVFTEIDAVYGAQALILADRVFVSE